MDVRCPQCQTLYELDDEQVSNRPVTLKCSQCSHVFRLDGRVAIVQENQRRWMIRGTQTGDILYVTSFEVLHQWIMQQKVSKSDEISRTGNRWVELGSIGEFTPIFQVVESISALGGDLADHTDVSSIAMRMPTKTPAPDTDQRERVRTSIQFPGSTDAPRPEPQRTEDVTRKVRASAVSSADLPPSPPGAAPVRSETPLSPEADIETPAEEEPSWGVDLSREADIAPPVAVQTSSSSSGIWGVVVLLVGGVCGYMWFFQRPMIDDMMGSSSHDVVAIGQPETDGSATPTDKPDVDPKVDVDKAVDAALASADHANDAAWTLWHKAASQPFYVALDKAYAAADAASATVELDDLAKKARTELENGHLAQASTMFHQVLDKDPKNAAAITGLGWTLLEQGKAAAAATQFEQSVKTDPQYGDAYIGLGTARHQLGQNKEAYHAYDLYLGRFPRGPKASIASYQMKQLKQQLGM